MMAEYHRIMDIRQHGEKPEVTLRDAFQHCVDSVKDKAKATHDSYQNSMNKLLGLRERFQGLWTLDQGRFMSDLSDDDLEDHLQARLDEGFSQNSINIEVRFMKRAWNLCRKKHKVNHDITFVLPKGFVKCRSLSEAEERTVIDYCIAKQTEFPEASAWSKAHDLFIYLIDTGVRLREATLVDWGAIDMRERYIDNYNFKTKKEVFVPISDRLFEVLSSLQNQPQPFVSMDRAIKNLRRAITECCPSSPRVLVTQGKATIHSCRDTYATRMLNNGMRLEEVSHLLGHATIVQTQKYAKFAKKEVADKARQMLNARKVA
ncbi:tyrosine-type recombinase/integrase [Ruegeria sp. ANG10]|uniref:tyrosine-type recombinase/integrase n=1 Tax=Ruegeria sp. ANG10 TaxID=3042467 RepID=UPI003455EE54